MKYIDAIREIKSRWAELRDQGVLLSDKSGRGLICPHTGDGTCSSGTGPHGTGPTENIHTPGTFICFACGWRGDAVDWLQTYHGIDQCEAVKIAADALTIAFDNSAVFPSAKTGKKTSVNQEKMLKYGTQERSGDGTALMEPSDLPGVPLSENAAGINYFKSRGLDPDVAVRLGVRVGRPREAYNGAYNDECIIYPTGGLNWHGRPVNGVKRPVNRKGATGARLFNAKVLLSEQPPIITEGCEDAIAIIQAGGSAVGLCGVSGTRSLIKTLIYLRESNRTVPPIIIGFDNDDPGRAAAQKLGLELDHLGIANTNPNLYGSFKDANDILREAPSELAQAIVSAKEGILNPVDTALSAEMDAARHSVQEEYMMDFYTYWHNAKGSYLSTGIRSLDVLLGGGLYPGLFVLGGRTGAGKTALALQIADNVAAGGYPVLYVALEMSREELTAKSVSRIAQGMWQNGEHRDAGSPQVFGMTLAGHQNALNSYAACDYFGHVGPHMYVMDGIGDIGYYAVGQRAEAIGKLTGSMPFIVIDYLQIMQPADVRMSDKQATDRNVVELKRISRNLNTPVMALSSLSRVGIQNGKGEVREDSYKESGGIEYTSDVLLGLEAIDDMGTSERSVQIRLLKNRRGRKSAPVAFRFQPGFCNFIEDLGSAIQMEDRNCLNLNDQIGEIF